MFDPPFTIIYYTFQNSIFLLFPIVFLPDKPTNLTVTNITSRSAEISWLDPKDEGHYGLASFRIKLKKYNSVILHMTVGRVNKYKIHNLTPDTTYEISVAAETSHYVYGFGEETTTSFLTSEEGECYGRIIQKLSVSRITQKLSNGLILEISWNH